MENVKNLETTMMYFYLRNQIQNNLYTNALLYSYFQAQNCSFSSIFSNFNYNLNQNFPKPKYRVDDPGFSKRFISDSFNVDLKENLQLEKIGLDLSNIKEKAVFDQLTSPSNSNLELINSKPLRSNSIFSNEEGKVKDEEDRKFKCKHKYCEMGFKTKRQLIMHHNKFEPECKEERNAIVKVIGKYKALLKKLLKKYGINKDKLNEIEKFQELKRKMEDIKSNLNDPEYFSFFIGDKVLDEDV